MMRILILGLSLGLLLGCEGYSVELDPAWEGDNSETTTTADPSAVDPSTEDPSTEDPTDTDPPWIELSEDDDATDPDETDPERPAQTPCPT